MARNVDLNLRQGETFRWSPVLLVPGATPDDPGTPLDVTGCTARAQFRQRYGSPVLVEITTENGGIVLGGTDGRITLQLTDAETDTLGDTGTSRPRTEAVWDLELVFASGDVRRLMQGAVAIDPNITREVVPDEPA